MVLVSAVVAIATAEISYSYTHFTSPKTWVDAKATCKRHGGHLAAVETSAENQRVYSACKGQRCWIGFNDREEEGNFRWSDGSQVKAQLWAPGEPDNTVYSDGEDEDCAYIHGMSYPTVSKRSRWGDHKCSERHAFICRIPVDYQFLPTKMTWTEATRACETQYGGRLASIHSDADNVNTLGACQAQRCWFGLNDRAVEGDFRWDADGSALDKRFAKWAPGQPDNTANSMGFAGDEDCVYIHGVNYRNTGERGQWGDHPCEQRLPAVCEVPATKRYTFFAKKLAFDDASAHCKQQGGDLASIQSFDENEAVLSACQNDRCWMGLNDKEVEGNWRWNDGKPMGDRGNFLNWLPGEPSNTQYTNDPYFGTTDEDCGYIHGAKYNYQSKRGRWGDHPCAEKMAFVCEVSTSSDSSNKKSSRQTARDYYRPPAPIDTAASMVAMARPPATRGVNTVESELRYPRHEPKSGTAPQAVQAALPSKKSFFSGFNVIFLVCAVGVVGVVSLEQGYVTKSQLRHGYKQAEHLASGAVEVVSNIAAKASGGKKPMATTEYALVGDEFGSDGGIVTDASMGAAPGAIDFGRAGSSGSDSASPHWMGAGNGGQHDMIGI
jgi:hypothetical protein